MKELIDDYLALCKSYTKLLGAQCNFFEIKELHGEFFMPEDSLCETCPVNRRDNYLVHRYGMREAHRWGGRFIYYCPAGLVFIAASVTSEAGQLEGGIVFGPVVMGKLVDVLYENKNEEFGKIIACLPKLSTTQIHHLAEIMSLSVRGIAPSSQGSRYHAFKKNKFLDTLYEVREQYEDEKDYSYIIEAESELQNLISHKNQKGARELLNQLLSYIYVFSDCDLDLIKARVLELIVSLSRSAIAAGADVAEIFHYNTNYILEIKDLESIEDLSIWLSDIIRSFIAASFDYVNVKHSDVIYKVMEIIKNEYNTKLTLDELAGRVYLSKSYLSSIFKNETGMNITSYINQVRIEKSKEMLALPSLSLAEIAYNCCFEDQSYFSKVFKKYVGVTPKRYRDNLALR
ncbi:MAG: AraC family transcriptional regulator [Christensenellales bacterium]|jgi:two-component system response regulator YesN